MSAKSNEIKIGQIWKSTQSPLRVQVKRKAESGMHWYCLQLNKKRGKTHKMHFGTLLKFFTLEKG